jgi:hypothetical protein
MLLAEKRLVVARWAGVEEAKGARSESSMR